ncbi:MAG: cytochrome c oxidase subunit 3 [Aliidongia sp.]
MGALILFFGVIAAIIAWWASQQRLAAKPWLEQGLLGEFPGSGGSSRPAAQIGLGVFLAVVGSLFALLISAYSMRMSLTDAIPLPAPNILWLNTGALILSSVALQSAQIAAKRGEIGAVRAGLCAAAFFALAFLAGQFLAWRQLAAAGFYLASNPASSFFYLITGVHGLHLAGGIVALGRTTNRAWRGGDSAAIRSSVGLCAVYWHFLLLLWMVLFALLTSGGEDFLTICRSLVE